MCMTIAGIHINSWWSCIPACTRIRSHAAWVAGMLAKTISPTGVCGHKLALQAWHADNQGPAAVKIREGRVYDARRITQPACTCAQGQSTKFMLGIMQRLLHGMLTC